MFNFFGRIDFAWTKVDQRIAVGSCIRELVYSHKNQNSELFSANYITPLHYGFS